MSITDAEVELNFFCLAGTFTDPQYFTGDKVTSDFEFLIYAAFPELIAEAALLIKPGVFILICFGLSDSGISL